MKLQATSFEHNKAILQEYFRIDVNFDMKCREFIIGDKKACIYFINGFVKDEGLQRLMEFLANIKSKNMPANVELFLQELSLQTSFARISQMEFENLRKILHLHNV